MPIRPIVAPPSSRPATLPSALRYRHPAQQRQRGADRELGIARRLRSAAHDLDPAPARSGEIEVLGTGADPADRHQHRREIERLGVDRHRGRNDRCPLTL
jgi:hypothetical protein